MVEERELLMEITVMLSDGSRTKHVMGLEIDWQDEGEGEDLEAAVREMRAIGFDTGQDGGG